MNKKDNTLVWVIGALMICIIIQLIGTMSLKSQIKELEIQIQQLKKKNEVGK
jgi:Tfp pilus assembly protein PilN